MVLSVILLNVILLNVAKALKLLGGYRNSSIFVAEIQGRKKENFLWLRHQVVRLHFELDDFVSVAADFGHRHLPRHAARLLLPFVLQDVVLSPMDSCHQCCKTLFPREDVKLAGTFIPGRPLQPRLIFVGKRVSIRGAPFK